MLVKFSEHCVLGDKENYHNLLCIFTAKGNLLENEQELLCCLLPFGEEQENVVIAQLQNSLREEFQESLLDLL